MSTPTGVDGSVTLPTGMSLKVDFWSGQFSQVIVNTSGFEDAGWTTFQGGAKSGRGSLTGTPQYNSTSTAPWFKAPSATGAAMTLQVAPGCTYAGTAIMSDENVSVDYNGAIRYSYNWVMSGEITVTWDESAI